MATARTIISRALRLIQVLAAGETAGAAEAVDALEALNDMLASWSASNLIVPVKTVETLTVSASPVALATRPVRIVGAWINDGASDRPVTLISQADYLGIANKGLTGLPSSLFCDGVYPVASVCLYPVPDRSYFLTLQRWDPLAQVPTLDTEIELPGEYREALAANLAIRLAPEYGTSVGAEVSAMASTSLDLLRGLNAQPVATLYSGIMGVTQRHVAAVGTDSMTILRGGW
jgi:hypothetical protein